MSDDPAKQMQVKIKQEDYLALHRSMGALPNKVLREKLTEKGTAPSLRQIFTAAEAGDAALLPVVAETLAPIKQVNSKFQERMYGRKKALVDEALLPVAKQARAAWDLIDSLPSDDHLEAKEARKQLAQRLAQEPKDVRGMAFKFYEARKLGKNIDTLDTSNIMDAIASKIKVQKASE